MPRKRLTFIVIPSDAAEVQEYRFSTRSLFGIALIAFLLAGGFVYFAAGYFSRTDQQQDMTQLREENWELTRRMELTKGMVKQLRETMSVLVEDDVKLRNWHQMEPLSSEERLAGVGGVEDLVDEYTVLPPRKQAMLEELDSNILRLQRETKLQEESFRQIEQQVRDSQEGWKHLPTVSPVPWDRTWVSSGFGYRSDPFTGRSGFHAGTDFAGRTGTPILAPADGEVAFTSDAHLRLGHVVVIVHNIEGVDESGEVYTKEGLYQTEYGHLEQILVRKGERVVRGQQIATMGNTGRSTGPHLHYAVRYQDGRGGYKGYIDPADFILDRPRDERLASRLGRGGVNLGD